MNKEKVIIIGGATASGKSDFALSIAKALNTEIISADSMQIYKSMDIGTAKVTADEMSGITHHMLDVVEPKQNYNVSDYVDSARTIITKLNNEGKVPVIVGGTGLYIDALIYDYEFNNADVDIKYRQHLEDLASKYGNEYVHNMLKDIDSNEAEKIHPNNIKRVIRALEIYKVTGRIKSENKKSLHYDVLMFIIDTDRDILYDRINKRVDIMMSNGLENEVKSLLQSGVTFDMQSMQAIGYKEWKDYIDGTASIDDVSELIKKNSRNYAKRQITWFYNKYRNIAHFTPNNTVDDAINLVNNFLDK